MMKHSMPDSVVRHRAAASFDKGWLSFGWITRSRSGTRSVRRDTSSIAGSNSSPRKLQILRTVASGALRKIFILDIEDLLVNSGFAVLVAEPQRTRPIEIALIAAAAAVPPEIDIGDCNIASVPQQVDEFCSRVKDAELADDFDVRRRLISEPAFFRQPQMVLIDNVYHVDELRPFESQRLCQEGIRRDPHIRPAIIFGHELDGLGHLTRREFIPKRKPAGERKYEPCFRRNLDAGMTGDDETQQCRARAARADDEKRGGSRRRARRRITRDGIAAGLCHARNSHVAELDHVRGTEPTNVTLPPS